MPIREMPTVGEVVTYYRDGCYFDCLRATFEVVDVNNDTGRIDLRAQELDKAKDVLTIEVKDKHGQTTHAYDFAWIEKTGLFAVNVEWDAWQKHVIEPVEFFKRLSSEWDE